MPLATGWPTDSNGRIVTEGGGEISGTVSEEFVPVGLDGGIKIAGVSSPYITCPTKSTKSISGYCEPIVNVAYRNRTYRTVMTAPSDYVGVRITIRNLSAATTWSGKIYVTTSSTLTDSPASATWTQVTFNGGDISGVFQQPAGIGTIAKNRAIPSEVVSDYIPLNSVSRADGVKLPYIVISGFADTGLASVTNLTGVSMPGNMWKDLNNTDVGGRVVLLTSAAGDLGNSNSFSGAEGYGSPFMEVEFLHAAPVMSICAVGDSITNGDCLGMQMASPGHFAANLLSTDTTPVCFSNHGFSSQTSFSFYGRLSMLIDRGVVPSVVVYSAFTPNDSYLTSTPFAISTLKYNLNKVISLCKRNNIRLVLSTGLPMNLSGANELLRNDFNKYVKSTSEKYNCILVDFDTLLKDPLDNASINPAYKTDTLHPNLTGYKLMGSALAVSLQNFKDTFFKYA